MGERLGRYLIAYLDTQVVIWLAQGDRKWISREAQRMIDKADLLISPLVVLELELLYEIRRITTSALDVQTKVEYEFQVEVCTLPFSRVATAALHEKWTREPFDRIIVAQAKANGLAYLISADEHIAGNYPRTIW